MSDIISKDTEYQINFIKKVIDECGPRLPCSSEEKKGAQIVAEEFEKITGQPSVVDEIDVHPISGIGGIPIYGYIAMFILMPLYIFYPLGVLIIGFPMFFVVVTQVFRYKTYFDFLFPKKKSQNVYNTLEPKSGNVDYTIILSGHIDSSWNWNMAIKHPQLLWVKMPYGIVCAIMLLPLSIYRLVVNGYGPGFWTLWILIPFIPGFWFIINFLSWDKSKGSPGATDNLGGLAISLGIAKFYKDNPEKLPKNCRLVIVGFGAEESGDRGSQEFVKMHKDDLLKESWNINIDGIMEEEYLEVCNGDVWLSTHYDKELCDMAVEAMKEEGIKSAHLMKNPAGGSDSSSFSRQGFRTTTIAAQIPTATDFYHTYNDSIERIHPELIEKTNKIVLRLIEKISLKYSK